MKRREGPKVERLRRKVKEFGKEKHLRKALYAEGPVKDDGMGV